MNLSDIEMSYPLSPSQVGFLFHRLNAPRAARDILQITCRWSEAVNLQALRKAWELVVARHAIFRLAFRWEGLAEPLQDIYRRVDIPFAEEDCRCISPTLQARRLEEYLVSDRRQGFIADRAPLFRLRVFQWGDASFTLVWTVHHAIADTRSIVLSLKEVFEYYEALNNGVDPSFSLPTRPYRDYVDWCRTYDPPGAEEFWRTLLGGFTAPTPLALARRATQADPLEADYGEQETVLPPAATDRLRSLAMRSAVTLNTVLQAAWAVLLSRYSGEDDVVFGATRACRQSSIEGAAEMIGSMVNTLPVRARLSHDESLGPLLKALRTQHLEVREYEQLPLTRIQEWSDLPRGTTLFETALVFHNYPYDGCFRYKPGIWPNCDFHFYLNLMFTANVMVYNEPGLRIKVIHDRGRLDDGAARRILGHLETLLEGIAADPDRPIRELPLLTEAEHRLLVAWNDTSSPYPRDRSLQELFEDQASRSWDSVAVVDGEQQLSYSELNGLANRVANYLRAVGVRPGDRVGIYMPRSLGMMIALLGIIKAGAAYLPLDADSPQGRLLFMLSDSHVSVVLTEGRPAGALSGFEGLLITVNNSFAGPWRQCSDENPPVLAKAEDLAYIIYTSGSTGIPKGVAIPQRAVSRLLFNTNYIQLTSADRIAQMANASFDAATFEIWGALLFGGCLVIVPKDVALSPRALARTLRQSGITTLFVTTLLFNHIAMEEPGAFRTLKQVLFGGEAVDPHWVREILLNGPPQRLLHVYGPTETTTFALWHPVEDVDEAATTIPIGKPISNTQAFLLDASRHPVPVGIPGQLCLAGDGLAVGYENRAELTAERFVADPFTGSHDGESRGRMYLTGDLVRRLPDGSIEFLGRLDRQVKIRGFRVELGEIEAVLRRHQAVRECSVVLREDAPGERRLVAYVVLSNPSELNVTELRRFLGAALPEYMVPAAFLAIPTLPLSATGKVDSSALPVPNRSRPVLQDGFLAPQTPEEQILTEIWREVLRLERVGVCDNFFDLGGDSILSIQVVSLAARAGLKLTPRMIFQHQTIQRLAAEAGSVGVARAEQRTITGSVPLTPIQHWFFEQAFPSPHHFNQSMLLQLRPDVDHTLLAMSVESVFAHHDALRMRFSRTETGWTERYGAPEESVQLEVTDLSPFSAVDQSAVVAAKVAELQASLDLSSGPLVRFHLFRRAAREPDRLFITVHHLVVDGVSWRILLEDLETSYKQLRQGNAVCLPSKTTSFQAWAGHLFEQAKSRRFEQELQYWVSQTSESVPLLPCGVSSQAPQSGDALTCSLTRTLPYETTRALLHVVPAAYQTRINDVLLTALAQVISKRSGSREVCIYIEGHGREEIVEALDLSRTLGWFTSIFPVRLRIDADAGPGEALRSIKEQLRRIPNNGIGYGLLRYLNPDPATTARLRAAPGRQVCFNYLGQFDQALADSCVFEPFAPRLELSRGPNGQTDHLLSIDACVVGGQFIVTWTYSQGSCDSTAVESLAAAYLEALEALIAHCQSPNAGGYTPSDFPESGLDQEDLDAVMGELGNA